MGMTHNLYICRFPKYAHHKTLCLHLAYSYALNEQDTQHSSLHSLSHKGQSISVMFSSDKISQHNFNSNIPYRPSTCTPQFLHTCKTEHICHAQYSNYIIATHNITHSKCTSTCTTHLPLPIPLPSTTLLCTNNKHKAYLCKWCQNSMHKM